MSDKIERAERRMMALAATSDERLDEAREFFAAVRSAHAAALDRISCLAELEQRMSSDEPSLAFSENVIPFPGAGALKPVAAKSDPPRELIPPPLPIAIRPILFIASSDLLARQAALEAHELAGRWAFVDFDAIGAEAAGSRSKWNELSGVTVYIRDLSTLAIEAQVQLAERLLEPQHEDSPFVAARLTTAPAVSLRSGKSLRWLIEAFCTRTIFDSLDGRNFKHIAIEAVACARIERPSVSSRWTSAAGKRKAAVVERIQELYSDRLAAHDRVH